MLLEQTCIVPHRSTHSTPLQKGFMLFLLSHELLKTEMKRMAFREVYAALIKEVFLHWKVWMSHEAGHFVRKCFCWLEVREYSLRCLPRKARTGESSCPRTRRKSVDRKGWKVPSCTQRPTFSSRPQPASEWASFPDSVPTWGL